MSAIPGYLTAAEVADMLDVDHSQVCRYCADKKLPALKSGNQWYIKPADVKKFEKPPVGNPNFRKAQ